MAQERDSFWQLERANRRKTVELVVIFILVYCLIGLALDGIFHTVHVVNYQLHGFPAFAIGAGVIAIAQAIRAYYRGSSVLLGAVGARDLAAESVKTQMVADVVDEMAMAAHIPRPRLCLMEDPAPNAFATGRDPAHSVICVTRGLVDQLDREELQGVIAHEIAHIRGHDTRIAQMAAVMVGGFGLVTGATLRSAAAQRRGDAAVIPGFGLVALPVVIFGGIGWLVSKMAAIALSREREYLADASAVEFTRNPTALIRALGHIARIESPLKASLRGVAPLFIVDPLECGGASREEIVDQVAAIQAQADKTEEQHDAAITELVVKGMARQSFSLFRGVFSTHPPIQDRIARLNGLLHQPSTAESEERDAERAVAAKAIQQVTQSSPDAMAAVIQSMFRTRPGGQLTDALQGDQAIGASDLPEPPDGKPKYANAADEAAYKKLYEYNLRLTGDKPPSEASPALSAGSLIEALIGGQLGVNDLGKNDPAQLGAALGAIDPARLRAALVLGMASTHKATAALPVAARGEHPPAKRHYFFWLVMALSAGAIIAGLAVRWSG
jgi:heat shock protein HtpX